MECLVLPLKAQLNQPLMLKVREQGIPNVRFLPLKQLLLTIREKAWAVDHWIYPVWQLLEANSHLKKSS